MKNKANIIKISIAVFGTAALVGCSNPAENVPPAEVTTAVEVPATGEADAQSLPILASSKVDFVGSKVTGSHAGGFKTFSGALSVADGKLVANGSRVEIDMESTWSDADKLTEHLKAPDFFDVATFKTSTFTFTEIKEEEGKTVITGNLELHGVTKSISFPAEVNVAGGEASLTAEFYINRVDFGIEYPGKKDDLIREEVVIKLAVNAKSA